MDSTDNNGSLVSKPLLEEIAATVDFLKPGWLRQLKDAVHRRVGTTWHEESQLCTAVLSHASNALDRDIAIGEFLHSGNSDFWINLPLFEQIIDTVDFHAEQIVRLEGSLPPEAYGDLGIGKYLSLIKGWVTNHPDRGEELLDMMLRSDDETVRRLHVTVLNGLGEAVRRKGYDQKRFNERLSASEAKDNQLRAGMAIAFPALIEAGLVSEDEYERRLTDWISGASSEQVTAAAIRSIALRLDGGHTNANYLALLRTASLDGRAVVKIRLIEVLRPIAKLDGGDASRLLHELVLTLATIDVENQFAIDALSWSLFSLVEKQSRLVMAFLRRWAERTDDPRPLWHSTRFLHVINHIPSDVFAEEVIGWIIVSRELEQVGLHLILDEQQLASIPQEVVANLTPDEVEVLALILRWHDIRVEAVYLLVSLVKAALGRDDCTHLTATFQTLLHHVVASYPGSASRVVAAVKDSKTVGSRKLVKSLRLEMAKRERALKAVHEMPDFVPSVERQRVYQRLEGEFRREINRTDIDDPGRFPFLSMMKGKEVQLLGEGAVLSTDARNFGAVQPLGRLSVAREWHLLEVLDPHSEYLNRVFLRAEIEKKRAALGGNPASSAS